MAFCKNCGNKLDDGAKFCPKCGSPTDSTQPNGNVADNDLSWSVELSALLEGSSKLEIVKVLMKELGLGINDTKNLVESAPCILTSGLSLDAAKELAQKLQVMGASVNIKNGTVSEKSNSSPKVQEQSTNQIEPNTDKPSKSGCWKKILYAFLAFGLIGFFAEKCGGDDSSTEEPNTTQVTEQVTNESQNVQEVQEEKAPQEESFLGTYEVTDKVGCTFRITLNEDETATITGVSGESVTYYCSWKDLRVIKRGIGINFSDEKPYIVYEGGADTNKYTDAYLKDGWLYAEDGVKSNNPNWRLKATKIK